MSQINHHKGENFLVFTSLSSLKSAIDNRKSQDKNRTSGPLITSLFKGLHLACRTLSYDDK